VFDLSEPLISRNEHMMMPSRGSCSLVLAYIALLTSTVTAAPPVNVGLRAAFGAPPYLVELL